MVKKSENKDTLISDVIKKVVSVGVGAAFMTEEAVKNVLADIPLPKDIVTGLVQNAKGAKEDFIKSVREEFKSYLEKLDSKNVADHVIKNYDIKVDATFKFVPKEKEKEKENKKS